jgi:hypothetical protein
MICGAHLRQRANHKQHISTSQVADTVIKSYLYDLFRSIQSIQSAPTTIATTSIYQRYWWTQPLPTSVHNSKSLLSNQNATSMNWSSGWPLIMHDIRSDNICRNSRQYQSQRLSKEYVRFRSTILAGIFRRNGKEATSPPNGAHRMITNDTTTLDGRIVATFNINPSRTSSFPWRSIDTTAWHFYHSNNNLDLLAETSTSMHDVQFDDSASFPNKSPTLKINTQRIPQLLLK